MTYQVIHPATGTIFEDCFTEDQLPEMEAKARFWNEGMGSALGPVEIRPNYL